MTTRLSDIEKGNGQAVPPHPLRKFGTAAPASSIDGLMVVFGGRREILEWNEDAQRIFGRSRTDVLHVPGPELEARDPWRAIIEQVCAEPWHPAMRRRFEVEYRNSEGSRRVLEIRFGAFKAPGSEECGATLLGLDVTEAKRATDTFRSVLEHAPIGMFIVQDRQFVLLNPASQMSLAAGPGTVALDLVHPDDRETVRRAAIAMLKGERSEPYTYRSRLASGGYRYLSERVIPITFQDRRAAFGMFEDVTDKHEQLDAMLAAAGRFLNEADELVGDTVLTAVTLLGDVMSANFPNLARLSELTQSMAMDLAEDMHLRQPARIGMAGRLALVGVLKLRAALGQQIERGEVITATNKQDVERIPELSAAMAKNIPGLERVAQIISLWGTPFTAMPLADDDVIIGASIVGLAHDYLDLTCRRASGKEALQMLGRRAERYHPEALAALGKRIGSSITRPNRVMKPMDLSPGMVVATDIVNVLGNTLVRAGTVITLQHLHRLRDFDVANQTVEIFDDHAA